MPNDTTYLQAYLPPVFTVNTLALKFELYDEYALVVNDMQGERLHPGALSLFGEQLELVSLHLDGRLLAPDEYELTPASLLIPATEQATCFQLQVVTRIYPQKNTELSGLYRSKQLFCTQCEAEGFRRITYFPDRPDVLAVYTTRIEADKVGFPCLLSNGNRVAAGDLPNGRHWVTWFDPFKKPSYLFALVAGDLACVVDEFVTCSGRTIALEIYV